MRVSKRVELSTRRVDCTLPDQEYSWSSDICMTAFLTHQATNDLAISSTRAIKVARRRSPISASTKTSFASSSRKSIVFERS